MKITGKSAYFSFLAVLGLVLAFLACYVVLKSLVAADQTVSHEHAICRTMLSVLTNFWI